MAFTVTGDRRLIWAGMGVALVAGLAWLWWQCARNPDINFLSRHGEAEWVIYPKPPDAQATGDFEISTVFRRVFPLERAPEKATLSLRAFKSFRVVINGTPMTNALAGSNWKDAADLEVAGLLLAGTNEIAITVLNRKAQPALWASLEVGSRRILTGLDWEASLLGAAWQPAWLAAVPLRLAKGNPLFGGENTFRSLAKSLSTLAVFTILASAIVFGVSKFIARLKPEGDGARHDSRLMFGLLVVLGIFWAALFVNNLQWLPRDIGFDEHAHEDYINYIRKEGALPLANQGWEMCQPPLYYMVGAGIESASGADPGSDRAAVALRMFGLVTSVAHLVLIFLSLRLVFPRSLGAQWFGVLLAASLPEHLYMSQYVTNEFLVAALVTGALYGCLCLWHAERESWKQALATGLFLGAALLTKVTAILAVPLIGLFLIHRAITGWKQGNTTQARTLVMVLAVAFAVGGWHYIRVWMHFGKPVVQDWDAASGFSWWTDKGFQTFNYFDSFGESLVRPFQSEFQSFGDGIYSSMWGDSFYGGVAKLENRPAWNYTLMAAGILLALLPMTVILTGLVVCAVRFLRRPEPIWFLFLGLAVVTSAAVFYLSLELPYFCTVKAFYALISLLPLCVFGAAGWEKLTCLAGRLRPVLYVAALVWAMNAYASFWIRGGASATHTMRGAYYLRSDRAEEGDAEMREALRINPHEVLALRYLAAKLASAGDWDGAMQETKLILADDPEDRDGLLQSTYLLAAKGNPEAALQEVRRTIKAAPDYALAYQKLATLAGAMGRFTEAAEAAREGLRITPFSPELHLRLAAALSALGGEAEANQQFQIACIVQPKWGEAMAHDQFGLALVQQKTFEAAAREFAKACRQQPDQPLFYTHLAAARAEAGQFDEAIASATMAMNLFQAQGNAENAAAIRRQIELYQARRAAPGGSPDTKSDTRAKLP